MNPFDLVKHMKNIQSQMSEMQSKLDTIRATGSSGGDMVSVTLNGKMEVISLSISEEIVDPQDVSTLEVLVASAFNAAVEQIQEVLKKEALSLGGAMQ
ncbi:MAG: YbaB/EbfC family nucleoid-associated protein [Sphaerochaetaceae bacterium]|jgi:DNA-binding YbaB/EbfC family protein